jgi:hypothetical protein
MDPFHPQLPGRILRLEKGILHIGPTLGAGVQGKVKRGVFEETGEVGSYRPLPAPWAPQPRLV